MSCITYKDTVRIIKPVVDGYGAESIGEMANVPSLFAQNTGWSHGSNQSSITSDAIVYVDPTNTFVAANFNRLEGMLVVANPFEAQEAESWYRITNVDVGRDMLLCNQIDNIQLGLKKTTEIAGVS